jgi:hypothetical protein
MTETTLNLFALLSENQVVAWTKGRIENLRFDPETGMLTYRLANTDARVSVHVLPDRVTRWYETCGKQAAQYLESRQNTARMWRDVRWRFGAPVARAMWRHAHAKVAA